MTRKRFGTVWGIMNSFIGISKAQTTNLAVVAPGIAEALLATAIGLVAAIPAVIIYNHFARVTKTYLEQVSAPRASSPVCCRAISIAAMALRTCAWRSTPGPEHDAGPNGTADWIRGAVAHRDGIYVRYGRTSYENVIKPCRALSCCYPFNCAAV